MKRGLLAFIMMALNLCLFAVNPAVSTDFASGDSDNATLDYSMDIRNISFSNIGFSSAAISDFNAISDELILSSGIPMLLSESELKGYLDDGSVYIYWQIQSSTPCTISLYASQMISENGNVINVSLSTVAENSSSEVFNVDNGVSLSGDMTDFTSLSGGEVFAFTPMNENHNQAVGSQKVLIETENLDSVISDNYKGTMTLMIEGEGF